VALLAQEQLRTRSDDASLPPCRELSNQLPPTSGGRKPRHFEASWSAARRLSGTTLGCRTSAGGATTIDAARPAALC
jgi:hypothetical protein